VFIFILGCDSEPNYQLEFETYLSGIRFTNSSDQEIYYDFWLSYTFHEKPFMYFEVKKDGKWEKTDLIRAIWRALIIGGTNPIEKGETFSMGVATNHLDSEFRMIFRLFKDKRLKKPLSKSLTASPPFIVKRNDQGYYTEWVDKN
jgi:hypothetical protein